jgi:hypothetical protein
MAFSNLSLANAKKGILITVAFLFLCGEWLGEIICLRHHWSF